MKIIFFLIFTIFSPIYSAVNSSDFVDHVTTGVLAAAGGVGGLIAGYALTKLALHVSKNISQMPSFSKVKPLPEKHSFEVVEYDKKQHSDFVNALMKEESSMLNTQDFKTIQQFIDNQRYWYHVSENVLLLKNNDDLVGFATYNSKPYSYFWTTYWNAHVTLLAIKKEERRKGAAKFFAHSLCQLFEKQDISYVTFHARYDNTIARQFYSRVAFCDQKSLIGLNYYYLPLKQSLCRKMFDTSYFCLFGRLPSYYI